MHKKLANFKNIMDIISTVNYIRKNGMNHRNFRKFVNKLDAEHKDIMYFSEVRWLSRGTVEKRRN